MGEVQHSPIFILKSMYECIVSYLTLSKNGRVWVFSMRDTMFFVSCHFMHVMKLVPVSQVGSNGWQSLYHEPKKGPTYFQLPVELCAEG